METDKETSGAERKKWRWIYGAVLGFLALEIVFFYYLSNLFR